MLPFKAIKEYAVVKILQGCKVTDMHQIWSKLRQCSAFDLLLQRVDTIIYNERDLSLSFKVKFANMYSKGLTFQKFSLKAVSIANNFCEHSVASQIFRTVIWTLIFKTLLQFIKGNVAGMDTSTDDIQWMKSGFKSKLENWCFAVYRRKILSSLQLQMEPAPCKQHWVMRVTEREGKLSCQLLCAVVGLVLAIRITGDVSIK